MSIESEIRSDYRKVIALAEVAVGAPLPRFRDAVFSFEPNRREGSQNPVFFLLPGLSGKAYWELKDLPQVVQDELCTVKQKFEQVRGEYLAALPTMNLKAGVTGYFGPNCDWKQHDLVVKGGAVVEGIRQSHPTLFHFCQTLLAERYLSGTYFAVMAPGCHLRKHCGAFNHALRLHLGLFIPAGDCALVVDQVANSWHEGEWLCFDDTFPHEAWNRTMSSRHILLARLLHPELSKLERQAFYCIEENPLFWKTYTEFRRHFMQHRDDSNSR